MMLIHKHYKKCFARTFHFSTKQNRPSESQLDRNYLRIFARRDRQSLATKTMYWNDFPVARLKLMYWNDFPELSHAERIHVLYNSICFKTGLDVLCN